VIFKENSQWLKCTAARKQIQLSKHETGLFQKKLAQTVYQTSGFQST